METETAYRPKKRSVKLSPEEVKQLKRYRKKFDTDTDCGISLGVGRETFLRVSLVGSGSPETISKIKEVLSNENNVQ